MQEEKTKSFVNKKSLSSTHKFMSALIASESDLLLYPLDTLTKLRQNSTIPMKLYSATDPVSACSQALCAPQINYPKITQLYSTAKNLGAEKLFAGVGSAALNKCASRTLRWSSQEKIQDTIEKNIGEQVSTTLTQDQAKALFGGAAGVTTGLIETVAFQPLDTAKTRKQIGNPCVSNPYASVGVNAVRSSFAAGTFFATYQGALTYAKDKNNPTSLEKLSAATAAGFFTSALTNPLDVVKTRLQGLPQGKRMGTFSMFKKVICQEGVMALSKGTSLKLLQTPGKSILPFFVFQTVKKVFEGTAEQSAQPSQNIPSMKTS